MGREVAGRAVPGESASTGGIVRPAPRGGSFAARLFGYDIFLSFALGPPPRGTHSYASDLARHLRERDFSVFFSEESAPPGGQLDRTLRSALLHSKTLVVIANRGTLREPRWVREEVLEFRKNYPDRPVIIINVDRALQDPTLAQAAQDWLAFQDKIWLDESAEAVAIGIASDTLLERLSLAPTQVRSNVKWRWAVLGVIATLVALAIGLGIAAKTASDNATKADAAAKIASDNATKADIARKNEVQQRVRAEKATGDAVIARDNESVQRRRAEDREREAHHQLLAANLNLARVFEERAGASLATALNERWAAEFQAAWLYSMAALHLEIEPDQKLPLSLGRLLLPGLRDTAFAERWRSPTEGRGAIKAIAFSPGDRLLAVGLEGDAVSVWDTNSGQRLQMMEDPGCTVQSAAFSTAAKLVAMACADGRVSLWKIADGSRTEVIQKGKAYPQRVAFIDDDRLLALGFADGKVQAWDLAAPSPRISQSRDLSHEDPLLAAFSPDLRLMAVADTGGTVRLRDTVTGQTLASHTEQEQASHIQSIAFEPRGEMLAWGAGHQFAMLDSPATVRLWARSGGEGPAVLTGHRRGVTALAFSADARMLASGSADGTVRLWKTRSKQLVAVLNSANGRVSQLAFSGDGRTLAVASVGPWNDFRPGAASVQLFEVSEARLTGALAQSSHEFMAVAFSPDGTKLYSGSQDGTVGIWDTVASTRIAELGGHSGPVTTLACSADGTTLTSGSGDRFNINKYQDTSVRIWSLREANQRAKIESRGAVTGMAITRHGDLGWVSADGSLRIGDRWLRRPGRDSEPLLSAALSPDGTVLATGSGSILQEGDWWSGFRLWEVATGRQLLQKELPVPVWTVAFSPDGNTLATGSGDFLGRHPLLNDLVCFWEISDGTKKGCLDIPHQRVVYSVAYSPRGDILVSGGRDGTLHLWDPVHLTELARLPIHEKAIFGVAFSPDGRTVASASGDGTIRLTDISVLYSLFAVGKPTANFAAVLDASRFLLPFELDGLDLRTKTARSLETHRFSGDAKNLQRLLNPRPPGTDPVRWMLREQQASR